MTKQEQIEKMQKTICANCKDKYPKKGYVCPWQDRKTKCYKCENLSEALYKVGCRKVPNGAVVLTPKERDDEMKATNEILAERDNLKAENKQLKTECALLDDELRIARQDTINVLNKLKRTIKNAIDTYYNKDGGGYYLAEDAIDDIDELIKELIKNDENQS